MVNKSQSWDLQISFLKFAFFPLAYKVTSIQGLIILFPWRFTNEFSVLYKKIIIISPQLLEDRKHLLSPSHRILEVDRETGMFKAELKIKFTACYVGDGKKKPVLLTSGFES